MHSQSDTRSLATHRIGSARTSFVASLLKELTRVGSGAECKHLRSATRNNDLQEIGQTLNVKKLAKV